MENNSSTNRRLDVIQRICEAVFILGIIAFMWLTVANHRETGRQLDDLKGQIEGLSTDIDERDRAAKSQLESIREDIETIRANEQGLTEQINGLTKSLEKLKQDTDKEVEELRKKLKEVEEAKIEKKAAEEAVTVASYSEPASYAAPTSGLTPTSGVNYYGDQKETYYNLPMDGVIAQAKNFGIEGEYWVREDGAKMYGDYVIVAANRDIHPMGSLVETSLGTGISLDTGGFAAGNPYQVDIATAW